MLQHIKEQHDHNWRIDK